MHVPPGFQVTGGQGLASPPQVIRVDDARQVTLVRAPSVLEVTSALAQPIDGFPGFSYVGVVEAAIGGITAKPVFLGRADVSREQRWPAPVRALITGRYPAEAYRDLLLGPVTGIKNVLTF